MKEEANVLSCPVASSNIPGCWGVISQYPENLGFDVNCVTPLLEILDPSTSTG